MSLETHEKKAFLKRALDTSNAFMYNGATLTVNPNIWDYKLREYEEANLVMVQLCEKFDFRGAGVDYRVTVDAAPSAASALTETVDVTISSFSTRQTTFTPHEYGAGYQLTRNEAVRAFFNVADRMVKKLGYALALKKDSLAIACAQAAATSTVIVNGVAAISSLAATDTLNYAAITQAARNVENRKYLPKYMVINYNQKQQLLNLAQVYKANEFGTRDAVQKGMVGELFGLQVFVTTQIPTVSSVAGAIVIGQSHTGESAVGYAIKRDPVIEKQYFVRGRYWDIVAHEEYDFQAIHPGAIEVIASYSG